MAVLRLLDVPHLDTGAGRTEVPPHKPALLLLHLAHEGTWVTREQLADLFWSEDRDGDARHNLRLLISRARKYSWASPLEVEPTRVRFLLQTDTHHFRDAVAREDWPAAITWYRKPFLAGLPSAGPPFDTWVSYEREALTGMWHKAMRSYAHDLSVTGRRAEAADLLHRLWRADVLAEDVLQAYLRAELAAGDRDAALRASATFRDVLHRDLGLTPMRETLDLEAALRQPASVPFERDERSSRRGSTFDSLPLVGRDRERTVLERERLVLVSGEPGVGKSRLLEEVMPSACWWRCVEGLDGVPYQPVLDALRGRPAALHVGPFTADLAHLLPDMLGVSPPPSDPVTLKPRLLEALARATEASSDVLVVDDAQWSDAATLELLALLARRARMRLVVAYRLPEVDSNLTRLLRTLRDAGASDVRLAPLTAQDVRNLVRHLSAGTPDDGTFGDWLYEKSGGNAFFALEMTRALLEVGVLRADDGRLVSIGDLTANAALDVPPRVTAIVERRLSYLTDTTRRVLDVMSVAREDFTPRLASRIGGLSEWGVVEGLEEARRANLLQGRHFTHDLVRQTIYAALSPERRALLHRAVAREADEASPAVLARHLLAAGDHEEAMPHLFQAADAATTRADLAGAAAWLREAKACAPSGSLTALKASVLLGELLVWEGSAEGRAELRWALRQLETSNSPGARELTAHALAALSDIELYGGNIESAHTYVTAALNVGLAESPDVRRRALESAVTICMRRGDVDAAHGHLEAAMALAPDDPGLAATAAELAFYRGDLRRARAMFEALIARAPGHVRVQTLENDVGFVCINLGDLVAAETWLRRSLARYAGVPHAEALTRSNLGLALLLMGRLAEADHELSLAEHLATRGELGTFLADVRHRQAGVCFARGDLRSARTLCQEAVSLMRDVGDSIRLPWFLAALSGVETFDGNMESARHSLLEARRASEARPHPVGEALVRLADLEFAGRFGEGGGRWEATELLEFARSAGLDEYVVRSSLHLASLETDDVQRRQWLSSSLDLARRCALWPLAARAAAHLAVLDASYADVARTLEGDLRRFGESFSTELS